MTFIAVGGAEDKEGDMTVWKRILDEAQGPSSRVCVITTATECPEATRQKYEAAFHHLGLKNFTIHHIASRDQANDAFMAEQIAEADVVFMSGGNQLKLTTILAATEVMRTMTSRYRDGSLVVAGTSAGAAAASSLMIYKGRADQGLEKDEVMMTAGLGFIGGAVIDTHFSERGRLTRLFNAVSTNPGIIGIGLDEDTGIIYRKDGSMEVIGSGTVTVVDGTTITSNNITTIKKGEPIVTTGITTHRLKAQEGYDMVRRAKTAKPV